MASIHGQNRTVYAESEGEFTKQWPLYGEKVDHSSQKRQVNAEKDLRNTFMHTFGGVQRLNCVLCSRYDNQHQARLAVE